MNKPIEVIIAQKVKDKGGNTYYVGGFVRDEIMHRDCKDIDIEVHGLTNEELLTILNEVGEPLNYGKSFGIYSLKGQNIDIALPRVEHNIGKGHKDFDISIMPNISLKEAISRRDFTINGIYKDVLTNEYIDPFNGIEDIKNKVIRHINEKTFIEDPLRVLRACQFSCRFDYEIDPKTIELCKSIDITSLSKQRINEEVKKALLQSSKPSKFFDNLMKMNKLDDYFKDINLKYIDKANLYIDKVNNKYAYLLSCLVLDTNFVLTSFINEKDILDYVSNMKENINSVFTDDLSVNELFYRLKDANDYIYLRKAINEEDLSLQYEEYKNIMSKPYVTGKDLIEKGIEPSEQFNEALEYATKLRLNGIPKQEALNMVVSFIKSNKL